MGIYSIKTAPETTIGNYLDNNFLESCTLEEAINISDKISNYSINPNQDRVSFMQEVCMDIMISSLSENTKNILIDKLYDVVKEAGEQKIIEATCESTELLMEFQGDPVKNQEFIDALKDLEELCDFNVEKMRKLAKYLSISLTRSNEIIKNPKKFKELNEEVRGMNQEFNDWWDKAGKKINARVTFNQFKSKIRKFNNKYSEVSVEEKKKFAAKMDKFSQEIEDVCKPWLKFKGKDGESFLKIRANIDELYKIDSDYAKVFAGYIDDYLGLMFNELKYTYGDIDYIYANLDLNRENTFLFKLINKLKK